VAEEAVHNRDFMIIEKMGAKGFQVFYRTHQSLVGRDQFIKI
jgi:hypothetical protein